jgi:hypothetical protein
VFAGAVSRFDASPAATVRVLGEVTVRSGIEVDEGRWGRSEGHIGSMNVRQKSA